MKQDLLLIDFENVQNLELSHLPDSVSVIVFVGDSQKSVPIDLVTSAQKLGERVQWQRINGNGKNSLDFHIACHLGRILEKSPQVHCTVLSRDKGFDPLLRYLNKAGLKCRRIENLMGWDSKTSTADDPKYNRVVEILEKSEKKARPRKLKTLSQTISSMFQKNICQEDIDRIIRMLFANKMISENNNSITYQF